MRNFFRVVCVIVVVLTLLHISITHHSHRILRRSLNSKLKMEHTPVFDERPAYVRDTNHINDLLYEPNLRFYSSSNRRRRRSNVQQNFGPKMTNPYSMNDWMFLNRRRRRLLNPNSAGFPNVMISHLGTPIHRLGGISNKPTIPIEYPLVQLPTNVNSLIPNIAMSQIASPLQNSPSLFSITAKSLLPTPFGLFKTTTTTTTTQKVTNSIFPTELSYSLPTNISSPPTVLAPLVQNINGFYEAEYYADPIIEQPPNGDFKLVPLRMFESGNIGEQSGDGNQPGDPNLSAVNDAAAHNSQEVRQVEVLSNKLSDQKTAANVPILNKIMDELEEIKLAHTKCSGKEEVPCRVTGSWVSQLGGIRLDLTVNISGAIHVLISETTPPKSGMLNVNWTAKGDAPLPRGAPFTLTAVNLETKRSAVFIGQCRVCHYTELISGWWLFGKQSKDCRRMSLAYEMHPDHFSREVLHNLREERLSHLHVKPNTTTETASKP